MKSYFLKRSGREEGPFSEWEVAQLFADQRVDRNTPCRGAEETEWRTIDECLPMLKYGTQLPARTQERPPPLPSTLQRVTVVDVDMPFMRMVVFMVKWAFAALPAMFIIWAVLLTIFVIISVFFGGLAALIRSH